MRKTMFIGQVNEIIFLILRGWHCIGEWNGIETTTPLYSYVLCCVNNRKDKFWRQLHAWEMCNQLLQVLLLLQLPLNHITIEQNWKFICVSLPTVLCVLARREEGEEGQNRNAGNPAKAAWQWQWKVKMLSFSFEQFLRTICNIFNWQLLLNVCSSIGRINQISAWRLYNLCLFYVLSHPSVPSNMLYAMRWRRRAAWILHAPRDVWNLW